ncbi:MAG: ribonuclease D [Methylococcales bacterium]|nr:ribonuclease D [Methylococcales bacterium]MDD5755199.1 ribonuclease D [Methylococcales bacterium]
MTPIEYIKNPEQLDDLCRRIENAPWIAVDTEFLREKTYYPKFCLLQLATPEWVACVDPIALPDLSELFDAIYNPSVIKVFHSCRQDLEIFYQLTGKLPTPIFDTQIAAPLLGLQENTGYATLVSTFLNINLNKNHTRADWSYRPLSDDEIQYAADDVIHLCDIYQHMVKQLTELGRMDWLDADFAALENPEQYETSPENAWLRVKGKNKLTGKQLSIVQAISQWREAAAQNENRPKNWLLRDDLLFDFAKLQPETMEALSKIRGISERAVNCYGKELCALVKVAKTKPPIPMPEYTKNVFAKNQQQEAIIDILFALVRIRAEENLLNPTILGTRSDLDALLNGNDEECLLLRGWRFSMVGKELQQLLRGELQLKVEDGNLRFIG